MQSVEPSLRNEAYEEQGEIKDLKGMPLISTDLKEKLTSPSRKTRQVPLISTDLKEKLTSPSKETTQVPLISTDLKEKLTSPSRETTEVPLISTDLKEKLASPSRKTTQEREAALYDNIGKTTERQYFTVEQFLQYYRTQKELENRGIVRQFDGIPIAMPFETTEASRSQNKKKNRYADIIPYDKTRVTLSSTKSNYINANFVNDYHHNKSYIATQAPTNETMHDFLAMIIECKANAVIMLTNIIENGKMKSARYWCSKNRKLKTSGRITVEVKEEIKYADFTIRKMVLHDENTTFTTHHFHFTEWPDHSCPQNVTMLLNFHRRFRNIIKYKETTPLVVHCSAGVGRTGTFIAIDVMLRLANENDKIDVPGYLEIMRKDRMKMIQTREQFIFVYDAIYESLECGYTVIESADLSTIASKMFVTKDPDEETLMEKEFKKMQAVVFGANESCMTSNYDVTDAMNIVTVDGYKTKKAYAALTFNDIIDGYDDMFWKSIVAKKITTIFLMKEIGEESTFQLPENESEIKFKEAKQIGFNYYTRLKFSSKKGKHFVNVIHYSDVFNNDHLPKVDTVLEKLNTIIKSQQYTGNGMTLIVARALSICGMLIATMNVLDQLKVEGSIDVFQTVRQLKIHRSELVEHIEQYRFIYNMVVHYLDTFETYSNFTYNQVESSSI